VLLVDLSLILRDGGVEDVVVVNGSDSCDVLQLSGSKVDRNLWYVWVDNDLLFNLITDLALRLNLGLALANALFLDLSVCKDLRINV
jgi:hypothetical protein